MSKAEEMEAVEIVDWCLRPVRDWMRGNKLKLFLDRTEVLVVRSHDNFLNGVAPPLQDHVGRFFMTPGCPGDSSSQEGPLLSRGGCISCILESFRHDHSVY